MPAHTAAAWCLWCLVCASERQATVEEEGQISNYFTELDSNGDGFVSVSEFIYAVRSEMWAGTMIRAFSRQPAPAMDHTPKTEALLARQLSSDGQGLVRTKSALGRSLGKQARHHTLWRIPEWPLCAE
jgi:hypothetical protein